MLDDGNRLSVSYCDGFERLRKLTVLWVGSILVWGNRTNTD
ncbi:MAG: hypothetical protein ACJAVO_001235 [Parvibaculaceae bacterium]|jgi:hypothetical protein